MRAIVYGGANNTLKDVVRPKPLAGQRGWVLVQVHAAGLNPVDAKNVLGDKLPHRWTWAQHRFQQSFLKDKIVGFDFAGTVAEDNDNSDNHHASSSFQRGDRVFGTVPPLQGTLAEYISVPLDQLCYIPSNYSFVEAAALPLVGLTALQSLSPHIRRATTAGGSNNRTTAAATTTSVLIIGASGGTGHVALQVARNLGASHVTAVCSGCNADFVRSCGATHVVDYTLHDQNADTLHRNLRQSPGWPFGVVLDCVTSADPRDCQPDYPALIRRHHLTTSNTSNNLEPLLVEDHRYLRLGGKSPDWIRAGLERSCFGWLSLWPDRRERLFWIRFPQSSPELRQLQEWAQQDGGDGGGSKLKVHIAETVPFTAEAVQGALDRILERRVRGKIVVQVVVGTDWKKSQSRLSSPRVT